MNEDIQDNSEQMQEKLAEILATMEQHERIRFKRSQLPPIDEEYIQKRVDGVEKALSGVLDDYVRNLVVQTVNVGPNPAHPPRARRSQSEAPARGSHPVRTGLQQANPEHGQEAQEAQKVLFFGTERTQEQNGRSEEQKRGFERRREEAGEQDRGGLTRC